MKEEGISQAVAAEASSAHARVNVPLNLLNWHEVPKEFHPDLLWFHQHILDEGFDWDRAANAVGYDKSSVFKFLKGTNAGSYANFCKAIRSYRRIAEQRATIKHAEFVENGITRLIFATLDYTLANRCMTLIVGESGMGKTTGTLAWRARNNHGRAVHLDCPPLGGNKGFLRAIARRVGVGLNLATPAMLDAVVRSFNSERMLICDNMHRAVPADPRSSPRAFDIIQHIFDETGCSIALTATDRLDSEMAASTYLYEQIRGRIGTPVYLPAKVCEADFAPILEQYIARPSRGCVEHAAAIANGEGRLRQLVERLKLASRIAGKQKERIGEEHFLKAIRIRAELSKNNSTDTRRGRRA